MNDFSAFRDSERAFTAERSFGFVLASGRFDDGAKCFLHVFGLANFVLAPLEMEAQDGDAPFIDNVWVNLAVSVWIRNHLAASGHANAGAVSLSRALLQRGAVAFFFMQKVIKLADAGHIAAAAKFDVIAARKIIFAVELPPGDVQVHPADAIVIMRRHF